MTVSIDKERGELIAEREFDVPIAVLFNAFLDPEQVAKFWGPYGMTTPQGSVTLDPRPGGTFEALMVNDADGSEHTMRATFIEIVPLELISFKEHGMGLTSTMRFTDLGSRTRLSVHQTDVPKEILGPEVLAGFNSYLDKLAAYLATL